jgi:hypothetical protein
MPDGGITAQNLPARTYITVAYQLQPHQLDGFALVQARAGRLGPGLRR